MYACDNKGLYRDIRMRDPTVVTRRKKEPEDFASDFDVSTANANADTSVTDNRSCTIDRAIANLTNVRAKDVVMAIYYYDYSIIASDFFNITRAA